MIKPSQFMSCIIRPTLLRLARDSGISSIHSEAAENLLIGTAIAESHLRHVKQWGGGPALGFYQIEPPSHRDLWEHWLKYRPELSHVVQTFQNTAEDPDQQLITNLAYATVVARLLFFRHKDPLPSKSDIRGLAGYWKEHYNTVMGKGTVDGWMEAYRHFYLKID